MKFNLFINDLSNFTNIKFECGMEDLYFLNKLKILNRFEIKRFNLKEEGTQNRIYHAYMI